MTDKPWHFARDQQQEGPIDESELQKLFAEGSLFADTLVWCEDMDEWAPASKIDVFASKIKKRPPPLPVMTSAPPQAPLKFTTSVKMSAPPPPVPLEVNTPQTPFPALTPAEEASGRVTPSPALKVSIGANGQVIVKDPQPAPQEPKKSSRGGPAQTPTDDPPSGQGARIPAAAPAPAAATPLLKPGAPPANPVAKSSPQPSSVSLTSDDVLHPHPWHRYFARKLDNIWSIIAAMVPAGLIIAVGAAVFHSADAMIPICIFAFIVMMGVYMAMEPIMLTAFGTTLGKTLFNIRLRNAANGTRLNAGQAMKRTVMVFLLGGGAVALIPFGALAMLIYDYSYLQKNGITKWDKDGHYRYEHHPMTSMRWILVCAAYFLACIVPGILGLIVGGVVASLR